MAQIGKLEEFDCITSDVDTYFARLESYFKANKVATDSKINTFISVAGEKTYKLLKSLPAPEKPKDRSLDDIRKLLRESFCACFRACPHKASKLPDLNRPMKLRLITPLL